jgi:hypothetical protein
MASSSVRSFGAASKAVLHQVDVARRVQQFYDSAPGGGAGGATAAAAAAAAPAAVSLAAGASAAAGGGGGLGRSGSGGLGRTGSGLGRTGSGLFSIPPSLLAPPPGGEPPAAAPPPAAGAAALGGGGGCFFSQLLPCPADPRLLAFVQNNMQVGLLDCASGEVVDHVSTLAPAAPRQLRAWDAAAGALLAESASPAGRGLGEALGMGRPDDFRPACCQSAWDRDGLLLYTAGALWEPAPAAAPAGPPGGGGLEGGDGAAAAPPPRQVPALAAVRLAGVPRPAGCGVSRGGEREGGGAAAAVRHVLTSHHPSAVFQDRATGSLLLGTATPLLLHVS